MEELVEQTELRESRCCNGVALHSAFLGHYLFGGDQSGRTVGVAIEGIKHVRNRCNALVGYALVEHAEVPCFTEADNVAGERSDAGGSLCVRRNDSWVKGTDFCSWSHATDIGYSKEMC